MLNIQCVLHVSVYLDEVCVESLINSQGYQCSGLSNTTSLVVTVDNATNLGLLDELVQEFLDRSLQVRLYKDTGVFQMWWGEIIVLMKDFNWWFKHQWLVSVTTPLGYYIFSIAVCIYHIVLGAGNKVRDTKCFEFCIICYTIVHYFHLIVFSGGIRLRIDLLIPKAVFLNLCPNTHVCYCDEVLPVIKIIKTIALEIKK